MLAMVLNVAQQPLPRTDYPKAPPLPDMTGKVVKMRSVVQYKPDGSRVMTTYSPGPDGKEVQMLRITYTKQK